MSENNEPIFSVLNGKGDPSSITVSGFSGVYSSLNATYAKVVFSGTTYYLSTANDSDQFEWMADFCYYPDAGASYMNYYWRVYDYNNTFDSFSVLVHECFSPSCAVAQNPPPSGTYYDTTCVNTNTPNHTFNITIQYNYS